MMVLDDCDDDNDDDLCQDRDIQESSHCDRLNRGRPHNNSISHFDSPAPRLEVFQQTSLWKDLVYYFSMSMIFIIFV